MTAMLDNLVDGDDVDVGGSAAVDAISRGSSSNRATCASSVPSPTRRRRGWTAWRSRESGTGTGAPGGHGRTLASEAAGRSSPQSTCSATADCLQTVFGVDVRMMWKSPAVISASGRCVGSCPCVGRSWGRDVAGSWRDNRGTARARGDGQEWGVGRSCG